MPSLQLLHEAKLHTLLPGSGPQHVLEASGVLAHEDHLIVIFDNVSRLARIDRSCAPHDRNAWLGDANEATGYEDITYNPLQERFYLLIEAERTPAGILQGEIVELDQQLSVRDHHALPWEFESDNKGFEGLTYLSRDGHDYVLALCEGNRCLGGDEGRQPGNGRIQIFQRLADGWGHVGTLEVPPSVAFTDYASLDVREDRLAVLSQESARVWLGTLDAHEWAFLGPGTVYALPEASGSETSYCTPEGIAWLDADLLAVVSDRRKDDHPDRCAQKDQSVHLFRIP